MPDTENATAERPAQQDSNEAAGKTQVQSAEFPEAPENAPTGGTGQLDILLDMDIPITVVLGSTQIPVRRLLQLGPGSVLQLEKPIEAPADLFLKDSKFAEAEVVVVDNRFAVRIKEIVGAAPVEPAQE